MQLIPSLDGLRAISVSLVIWSHIWGGSQGTFGVKVFFVISGFLITSLLIEEHARTGDISLKNFYARRALRIFPASYFYIAVIALLSVLGMVTLNRHDLLLASAYLMSYHENGAARPLQHLWSLSVEEQFYFLWPAALVLFWRFGKMMSFSVVLLMPIIRMLLWILGYKSALLHLLPFSVDALAVGCLMAQSKPPRIRAPWLWLIAGALLTQVHPESLTIGRRAFRFFQDPAVHLLIVAAIIGSIHAHGWWSKFLNSKVMIWLGTISYSIYLWQELFAFSTSWPAVLKVAATLAAAAASYFLVERPFLNLRHHFGSQKKVRAAAS